MWCYKIVFNIVNISADELFCNYTRRCTRGHHTIHLRNDPFQVSEQIFLSNRFINVCRPYNAHAWQCRFHNSYQISSFSFMIDLSDVISQTVLALIFLWLVQRLLSSYFCFYAFYVYSAFCVLSQLLCKLQYNKVLTLSSCKCSARAYLVLLTVFIYVFMHYVCLWAD